MQICKYPVISEYKQTSRNCLVCCDGTPYQIKCDDDLTHSCIFTWKKIECQGPN